MPQSNYKINTIQNDINTSFDELMLTVMKLLEMSERDTTFHTITRNSIFIYAMTIFERSLVKIVDASLMIDTYSQRYSELQQIVAGGKEIGVTHISSFCKNRFFDLAKLLFNTNIDLSNIEMKRDRDFLRDITLDRNDIVNPDQSYLATLVDDTQCTNEMFARRNALVHRDLRIDSRYLRDAQIEKKVDLINSYIRAGYYNWNLNDVIGEKEVLNSKQIIGLDLSISHNYIDCCLSKIKKILFLLFEDSLSSTYPLETENFLNHFLKQSININNTTFSTQNIEDCSQIIKHLMTNQKLDNISNPRLYGNMLIILESNNSKDLDDLIIHVPKKLLDSIYVKFVLNLFSGKKGSAIDLIPIMIDKEMITQEDLSKEPVFKKVHSSGKFLTIYKKIFSERFLTYNR